MIKIRTFLCCVVCLLFNINIYAQKDEISPEDLKKWQEKYQDAMAMIYSSEKTFTFELDKKTQMPIVSEAIEDKIVSLRSKIKLNRFKTYDSNSEISVPVLLDNRGHKLGIYHECANYNVDGIFHSDAKVCGYQLPFDTKGDLKVLKVKKTHNDIKYLTSVYFHDELPVREGKIIFKIPDWLNLELKEFNFEAFEIDKKIYKDEKNKLTTIEFIIKNAAGYTNEENAPGPSYTYPHLLVLAKSIELDTKKVTLLNSVDDLYAWYASLVKELEPKRDVLDNKVKELIAFKTTDLDKIKAIYYWVQDNIRYIAFEDGIAGFKPEEAHLVFQNKYGDCKGMANLTKEMLKIAGFDARLTWMGTNNICYKYDLPSLAVDNHMVCTVFLNGKKYVLDATEKFNPLEDYAERIQGRPIMIENNDKYILDSIPTLSYERNLVSYEQTFMLDNDILKGQGSINFAGEAKQSILYHLNYNTENQNQEALLEKVVTRGNKNILLKNLSKTSLTDREAILKLNFEIELNNMVSIFGNEVYITPDIYQSFKNEKIKEERISNWVTDEKNYYRLFVNFQMPEGYTIKHLPENLQIKENEFEFDLQFSQKDNLIKYQKIIIIPKGIIHKENFKKWNETIDKLKNIYNDQIILIKN